MNVDFKEFERKMNKALDHLAEEFGAVFLPCQTILNEKLKLAEPKHWRWDGVHPTPAGHQVLTDAWLAAAKDLLP